MTAPAPRKRRHPAPAPEPAADAVLLPPGQASRTLMILGLLRSGPKHGYELHRVIVAHGTLYADFKKPTLYHLLHRLSLQGAIRENSEPGARGPRGERLVYSLTAAGEALLFRILRGALASHDTSQTNFEVAVAFMGLLPAADAQALLRRRLAVIRARRAEVVTEIESFAAHSHPERMAARVLAADHSLSIMDAEIAWADRAIRQLAGARSRARPATPSRATRRARAAV